MQLLFREIWLSLLVDHNKLSVELGFCLKLKHGYDDGICALWPTPFKVFCLLSLSHASFNSSSFLEKSELSSDQLWEILVFYSSSSRVVKDGVFLKRGLCNWDRLPSEKAVIFYFLFPMYFLSDFLAFLYLLVIF